MSLKPACRSCSYFTSLEGRCFHKVHLWLLERSRQPGQIVTHMPDLSPFILLEIMGVRQHPQLTWVQSPQWPEVLPSKLTNCSPGEKSFPSTSLLLSWMPGEDPSEQPSIEPAGSWKEEAASSGQCLPAHNPTAVLAAFAVCWATAQTPALSLPRTLLWREHLHAGRTWKILFSPPLPLLVTSVG